MYVQNIVHYPFFFWTGLHGKFYKGLKQSFFEIFVKIKSHHRAYLSTPFVAFRGWFVFVGYVFKIQLSFCHVVSVSLLHQCHFIRSSFHCFGEATTCATLYLVRRRRRSSNRGFRFQKARHTTIQLAAINFNCRQSQAFMIVVFLLVHVCFCCYSLKNKKDIELYIKDLTDKFEKDARDCVSLASSNLLCQRLED